MELVFKRPECLIDVPFHFCPGCHHGTAHRLVAEAIDYFKIREKTIGVASVGCSVFMYDYFNIDVLEAPHGRASAVASGVNGPEKIELSSPFREMETWEQLVLQRESTTANRGETSLLSSPITEFME